MTLCSACAPQTFRANYFTSLLATLQGTRREPMETYPTPNGGWSEILIDSSWCRLGMGDAFRFDVDVLDRFGGSGLHWAASGGYLEVGRVDRNLDVCRTFNPFG